MVLDWQDSLPYDELAHLAVAALEVPADRASYLDRVADLAWTAARALANLVDARLVLVADSAATAVAYADDSIELSLDFLRRAAFESLCAAEERTLGFARQVGY